MKKIKLKLKDTALTTCFYSGNTSMYRTIPPGHTFPPIITESKIMEWDWNVSNNEELVFYTDSYIPYPEAGHKKRVAWLIEPYCKQPHHYDWISKNNHLYDYVLTFEKFLLDRGENFIYYPYGGCWIEHENRTINHDKTNLVSIIASGKRKVADHFKRHEIIAKHSNIIDVMGMGYKPIGAISEGLTNYMFHIAMENQRQDFYFTEKLINPLMTGTVPIYYGMPSIGEYFDTRGMIIFNDINEIGNILNSLNIELYKSMLPYIEENFKRAHQYVLAEDNFFEKIMKLLNMDNVHGSI